MVYREGPDPDADARESDAIKAFGRWSERLRALVLAASAGLGIVGGTIAAAVVVRFWRESQRMLDADNMFTPRYLYVLPAAIAFIACVFAGRAAGKALIRGRTPGKLVQLAAVYEVPIERLRTTTDLANRL